MRLLLEMGMVNEARAYSASHLQDPRFRDSLDRVLEATEAAERANVLRVQDSLLTLAAALLEHGDKVGARQLAIRVLSSAADSLHQSQALELLLRRDLTQGRVAASFEQLLKWVTSALVTALAALIVVFLYWLLEKLARRMRLARRARKKLPPRIVLTRITDHTKGDLEIPMATSFASLALPHRASAGLLALQEREFINEARANPTGSNFQDLNAALSSLPGYPGPIVSVLRQLYWRIRSAGDTPVAASLRDAGGQIEVRLTARTAPGTILQVRSVSGAQDWYDPGLDAIQKAVAKLYYLISRPETPGAANDAYHRGLDDLDRYASSRNGGAPLAAALKAFQEASFVDQTMWDAQLHQGIVLDLLEQHSDAQRVFEGMEEDSRCPPPLKHRASYNRAISLMRQYNPERLKASAEILANLEKKAPDLGAWAPLPNLAHANVIAHYPIFWERILYGNRAPDEQERLHRKKEQVATLEQWLREVEQRTTVANTTPDPLLDRQLEWARMNARGNVYLNIANGFLLPPAPVEFIPNQDALLRMALSEFEKCEILLPPGVETLTNLAATHLALGNRERCREYCDRAIRLNASYEYAYYRKAQAWVGVDNAKAAEVCLSFAGQKGIREFRELCDKVIRHG
ncbi:MAG TPA: hypothetical protein VGA22_07500 [Gemmatimonadales bacterium]